jgi:amino acid transporter
MTAWELNLKILLIGLIIPSTVLLSLLNYTNVDIFSGSYVEIDDELHEHFTIGTTKMKTSTTNSTEIVIFKDVCGDPGPENIEFCNNHSELMNYVLASFILSIIGLSLLCLFFLIDYWKKKMTKPLFFTLVFVFIGVLIAYILLFVQIDDFKSHAESNAESNANTKDHSIKYVSSIMTYTGLPIILQSLAILTLGVFYWKIIHGSNDYTPLQA